MVDPAPALRARSSRSAGRIVAGILHADDRDRAQREQAAAIIVQLAT